MSDEEQLRISSKHPKRTDYDGEQPQADPALKSQDDINETRIGASCFDGEPFSGQSGQVKKDTGLAKVRGIGGVGEKPRKQPRAIGERP